MKSTGAFAHVAMFTLQVIQGRGIVRKSLTQTPINYILFGVVAEIRVLEEIIGNAVKYFIIGLTHLSKDLYLVFQNREEPGDVPVLFSEYINHISHNFSPRRCLGKGVL